MPKKISKLVIPIITNIVFPTFIDIIELLIMRKDNPLVMKKDKLTEQFKNIRYMNVTFPMDCQFFLRFFMVNTQSIKATIATRTKRGINMF